MLKKLKPVLIVAGEPNSVFLEIYFKALKKNIFKSPLILICCKKNLQQQMKKLNTKQCRIGSDTILHIISSVQKSL